MWEFSLYFEKNLLCYFNQLCDELKNKFKHILHCVSIGVKQEKFVFMVAFPKQEFSNFENLIKFKIAEIICVYYKPLFIYQSINNFDLKLDDNIVLLSILSCYENQQDILQISKKLQLNSKLYLSSFVDFKLADNKMRWQEIGKLMNENAYFLMDKKVKKELAKFLLSGLQQRTAMVNIELKSNQFKVTDDQQNILLPQKVFFAKDSYDDLLYLLMNYFPQKISVRNCKQFDVSFLDKLYNLFGENLKLIE